MSLNAGGTSLHLRFDFYGVAVAVATESAELATRLRNDFSHFSAPDDSDAAVKIAATLAPPPPGRIPAGTRGRRTRNCLIYDLPDVRINDYGDRGVEARVEYRFATDEARVYATELDRLHEVTYLLIQSRVGKRLDQRGLHRLHAMAVRWRGQSLVCTLPMGAGKTTLFLELTKDERTEIISDDSPLVARSGGLLAYPLRIGVKPEALSRTLGHPGLDPALRYDLRRMRYGLKHLFPLRALPNRVAAGPEERIVLVTGRRRRGRGCEIRRASAIRLFPALFLNLVIGVGLPMMREYFVEDTATDFAAIARIFFSRLAGALRLLREAELCYVIFGDGPEENADALRRFLGWESAPARTGIPR